MATTPQRPAQRKTSAARKPAPSKLAGKKGTQSRKGAAPRKRGWNYPRQGLGPVRRWLPSWRFMLASIFAVFALGIAVLGTLYATTKVPDPADFALARATTVYYSDGETVLGTLADYDRKPVALDTLPEYVAHAVVASEDQSFYTNNGISIRGLARAFVNNVTGGETQGGSTLTQQYVERYFLGTTTSISGKVREAMIAIKIDRQQSKDEILENYLNTIYFGRGAYGIEVASQKYFGVSAKDLNLSQSALLIAIIPAPSAWDPAVSPDTAQQRWQRVLNNMVSEGYISQADADAQTFPETLEPSLGNSFAGTNGYLLASVISELEATGKFTADDLNQNGYKIVTTIDPRLQQAAVDAVHALPEDRPENNYVGLISADPSTGAILAMYGGEDYLVRQQNNATQDRAQGGSTFKTFGLAAALENGVTLTDTFPSASPMDINGLEIENADGLNRGTITLREATKHSVNSSYVLMNSEVGPEKTREAAVRAGLPEDTPGLDDTLTNVLGTASPTAKEMATVFSTYASGGLRHQLYIVGKVETSDSVEVYSGVNAGERVFDEDVMNALTYALQAVTESNGTAGTVAGLGRPVAGKTGTSSGPVSAWFAGYIPQMVTVVNMYQINPETGGEDILSNFGGVTPWISGGTFPADVWMNYMKVATEGMEIQEFPNPPRDLVSGPEPTPTPTPTPTETPTEAPAPTEAPVPQQPQQPQQSPSPSPSPSPTPQPTQAPAPEPTTQPTPAPPAEGQLGAG